MIRYNIQLDDDFYSDRKQIYDIFTNHYKNTLLEKYKDENGRSHYITKVQCLLLDVYRYIVATVPHDSHALVPALVVT